jgi:16S rRNA (guanine(966)-N(2))-methyltransferase RsmD
MKIIGGQLKGRNFYMPAGIHPTQNIVRKAAFDILGQDLEGFDVLELFAGSGALGLEAFSRGAARVTFVEKDQVCVDTLMKNFELLGLGEYESAGSRIRLIQNDSFMTAKRLAQNGEKFDIIFADPPYGRDLAKKILKTLVACDILHPNALVIIQHEKREILPEEEGRFFLVRERQYGSSKLTIYQGKQV